MTKANKRYVLAVLKKMDDWFQGPERWCREVLARDAEGYSVSPRSPKAESTCLIGAVGRYTTTEGVQDDILGCLTQTAWNLRPEDFIPPALPILNDDPDTSFDDIKHIMTHPQRRLAIA